MTKEKDSKKTPGRTVRVAKGQPRPTRPPSANEPWKPPVDKAETQPPKKK